MSRGRDSFMPVAEATYFDDTTNGFIGENAQLAIEDIRNRHLSSTNLVTTSASGTTTALVSSYSTYIFSGTATGHKLDLPNATLCTIGHKFELWNLSSQNITVRDFAAATLLTLKPNGRTEIILRDNSASAGVWVSTYTLDNGNVFGTQLYYEDDDTETSNNSATTWVNKITLTTPDLPLGDYLVQFQFNWRTKNADRILEWRVQQEAVTIDTGAPFSGSTSDRQLISGFKRIQSVSGINDFTLDFRRGASSTTVYMYNARLFVWRVA